MALTTYTGNKRGHGGGHHSASAQPHHFPQQQLATRHGGGHGSGSPFDGMMQRMDRHHQMAN